MIIVLGDDITNPQKTFGDEKIYKDYALLTPLQEELHAKQTWTIIPGL